MLYLLLNVAVISLPLAFSWHPKIKFFHAWKSFWPACLLVLAGFIAWDVYFTHIGIWGFNGAYLVGWPIFGLPIEEWLFFICIPYACVFTYYVLKSGHTRELGGKGKVILAFFGVVALLMGVLNVEKAYTVSATIPSALLIGYWLWKKPPWLGALMKTFMILIPAFVITNGVLTGPFFWDWSVINSQPELILDPVVWYNNAENLGVRLFSIPFDDFFYGFLLIGLNVTVFESFQKRVTY